MTLKFRTSKIVYALITIITLISSIVANASDYKTMIRYDRVWESVSVSRDFTNTVNYMKFDGECQFLGKTFHRIVTFKQTKALFLGPTPEEQIYEFIDNVYLHEGFMREEDGKVYTLATGNYDTDIEGNNIFKGGLLTSDSPEADEEICEMLIYDFNCQVGDSFSSFGNDSHDVIVERKSIVSIDGEDCINLGIDAFGIEIIEGIGPTDYGCLNNITYAVEAGAFCHNFFNRLYDETGRLLYESPQVVRYILPDNLFSSVGVVTDSGDLSITADGVAFGYDNRRNKVRIYDMEGRQVASESAAGRMTIPTSHLTPGMYIAEGQAEGCAATRRKFIVR